MRASWPDRPDFVAIDGKTSRRSHDRAAGTAPIHLVSAFATTSRLVLGQEAVADKSNELTAIPVLLARLAENNGLRGAIVFIDAIATNATIATAIKDAGAGYLLAVKANQPTLRAEVEAGFAATLPGATDTHVENDKSHGRIEQRTTSLMREIDWLWGNRRFPGELRLPDVACVIRVQARIQRGSYTHAEKRDTTCHRQPSTRTRPIKPFEATGESRTACTGCSTSASQRTSRVSGKGSAPRTWPSSGTSPSTSSGQLRTKNQSSCAGKSPGYLDSLLNANLG